MAEKITIAKRFEEIIATYGDVMSEKDIKFLRGRAEQASKKNANRKPTKVQVENEGIKAEIIAKMESGKSYVVSEIQSLVGIATNQKTSALIRQLVDSNLVKRNEVKGKAYFTKVSE